MTQSRIPSTLRVLVVGGGVAALETMLALRQLAEERVEIELVAAEPRFLYRPLAVAEPFGSLHVAWVELASVAAACNALFTLEEIECLDADRRLARARSGATLAYDIVVLATGARPLTAVAGALTFRGPADVERFRAVLDDLETGAASRVVFAVPGGVTWPLPLYELALSTAAFIANRRTGPRHLTLVTPEAAPLGIFGSEASAAIRARLAADGIELVTGRYPVSYGAAGLEIVPGGSLPADRVVALARLEGGAIAGVPVDAGGFIPTDRSGRVSGLDDVYAAGDATAFPVKQGGLATQQADTVAETIAARAGAPITPQPFRPVLRGLLLTGGRPLFMRAELAEGLGGTAANEVEPLWWPPSKIAGRYLAPFLAEHLDDTAIHPPVGRGLPVEVDLEHLLPQQP